MNSVPEAAYYAAPAVALLAWAVARHERLHGWFAGYATWMAGGDWLMLYLREWRMQLGHPKEGLGRAIFHLDQVFALSWYFLFLALCVHYFLGRCPWAVLVGWAVAAVALAVGYPQISGHALTEIYQNLSVGCLVATWLAILAGMLGQESVEPRLVHLVLMLYAAEGVALRLLSWMRYLERWPDVRAANLALYLGCALAHLVWLARRRAAARAAA